ncbi:MAG: H+-translocating transhydrogenase subunit beta [Frankiales bacterium]|nr:H+-translocating transhydrogenase subunit beta [Frankiales bacterium]
MNLLPLNGQGITALYLLASVCFILALKGLSSPKGARNGNLLGAFGALVAVVATFLVDGLHNRGIMAAAIAVGVLVGVPAARVVKMTQMPQMVALFNGVGGGAAAIVSIAEFHANHSSAVSNLELTAVVFTTLVGWVSFTGSLVTFAKLQELITGRPITFPGSAPVTVLVALGSVGLAVAVVPTKDSALLYGLAAAAAVLGFLFVLPVGGADVPIVISLLNAFTGLTVAAAGYVLDNKLLLIAGTLVGASGTLLTQLMASAMGRSIFSILFGAFKGGSTAGSTAEVSGGTVRSASPEDVGIMLAYARKVLIVPGYGLAVAQAQHTIRELTDLLEEKGIDVAYAIHPVAGRMPGHMNVLLAEANVPYDQLKEMDEVNPQFASTDVVLVVGANDVVNPAAKDSPGSPIYGMPILNVEEASAVVFLKRSMRPGFAGIDNSLLYNPKTTLLFGDAKDSLTKLLAAVKAF